MKDRIEGGLNMCTIQDLASTFLNLEPMTPKKLQKLCYYAQAWHLALYNRQLVDAKFEAWVHGPVCRELYNEYKMYKWNEIDQLEQLPKGINDRVKEFVEIVYNTYGEFDGDELEALTHREEPWMEARKGLEEWEPSKNIIRDETMESFYWNAYEKSQND